MLAINPFLNKRDDDDSANDTSDIKAAETSSDSTNNAELDFSVVSAFIRMVFSRYLEEANNEDRIVYEMLINGQSIQRVAFNRGLSDEKVKQIFFRMTQRINRAFIADLDELVKLRIKNNELKATIEKLQKDNDELRHRNYLLEIEYLSSQSVEVVDELLSKELSLCTNAKRLLKTPARFLPLSTRVINVLKEGNIVLFEEIPQLSTNELYMMKGCGKKTIYELEEYLSKFSLKLGMTYKELISQMADLTDENISPDNYEGVRSVRKKVPDSNIDQLLSIYGQSDGNAIAQVEQITLDDVIEGIGTSKKMKKKWAVKVKRILKENDIDSLEKLLSLTPSGFLSLEGVGRTTLYYTRRAIESFGIIWSDVTQKEINQTKKDKCPLL